MSYRYPDTVLLIFAKAPVPGRVKTRLIPFLGKEGACELYTHMATDIISRLSASFLCPVHLYCQPDPSHIFFREHARRQYIEVGSQTGSDPGARMHNAIAHGLKKYQKAIVIGTDCPDYSAEYVEEAIKQLDVIDVVVGPAYDGGFVLIGMKKVYASIFHKVEWGGKNVLQTTRRNIATQKLTSNLLPPLHDVDTVEDLKYISVTSPYNK